MIPKKPKQIIKQLVEDNDLNELLVDSIITFFYKEVRQELTSMNHTKINIDGLGQFVVKTRTVDNLILKYERIIAKLNTYSYKNYHNKVRLTSRLKDLYKIKIILDENKLKKETFLIEKNARKTNNNLEE
jgi:hypothetical protein